MVYCNGYKIPRWHPNTGQNQRTGRLAIQELGRLTRVWESKASLSVQEEMLCQGSLLGRVAERLVKGCSSSYAGLQDANRVSASSHLEWML